MMITRQLDDNNAFIGLSTDSKPENANNGSSFFEMDTSAIYYYDATNEEWSEFGAASGSSTKVEPITITENGTYTAQSHKAYSPITVSVPQTTIQSATFTENGSYTAPTGVAYSPVTIDVPNSIDKNADVRFFDPYDSSIVASYSAEEFANLSDLPSNPVHEGLISQGWNWSLADAKEQVAYGGFLDIGQMYITSDNSTRVYIHLVDGGLSPQMYLPINGTVNVDWGDGTEADSQTSNDRTWVLYTHTYEISGDYVIKISGDDFEIRGAQYGGSYLLYNGDLNINNNRLYQSAIIKVELGSKATLGTRAFSGCGNLKVLTIPASMTSHESSSLSGALASVESVCIPSGTTIINSCCGKIMSIPASVSTINVTWSETTINRFAIPKNVSSIPQKLFYKCHSLERYNIPLNIIEIPFQCFYETQFKNIVIPSNITSIANYAFYAIPSQSIELNNVTFIGENAFSNNIYLQEIIFPSVISIGTYAFSNCDSLTNISFSASIQNIAKQAFSGTAISKITFLGSTPPTVGENAFPSPPLNSAKIYVPQGSLEAYLNTPNMPDSNVYTYIEY